MSKIIIKSDFDVSTTMRYVLRAFHEPKPTNNIILIFGLSNVVVVRWRLNKNGTQLINVSKS